jgi:hypothetical protein
MGSSWMLRAAAAPELFLTRGFARFVSRWDALHPRGRVRARSKSKTTFGDPHAAFGVVVPNELGRG